MIDQARAQAAAVVMLAYTALVGATGYGIGWWMNRPAPVSPVAAMALPEVRQADGSVIAAREPVTRARPAQMLPKGAAVTSTAKITIRPHPVHATGGDVHISDDGAHCSCDDIAVAITTLRDPTGERLVVSADGGDVLAVTHRPVIGQMVGQEHRNAVGLSVRNEGGDRVFGVVYQRDWPRLRAGVQVEESGVGLSVLARF